MEPQQEEKRTPKREEKVFYFSVEGQTEKVYLQWLEDLINKNSPKYRVKFDIIISRNPLKRLNSLPPKEENKVYHLSDMESTDPYHTKQFIQMLDNLTKAKKHKRVRDYKLGYSNQTFDLWLILHKTDSFAPSVDRKKYINQINKVFEKKYRGMQEFKKEDNLKRLFKKFTFTDVLDAIDREDRIMKRMENIGYTLQHYKGFEYYKENPSLTVGTVVKEILKECELY